MQEKWWLNEECLIMYLENTVIKDLPFDGKLERLYRIKKGHFPVFHFYLSLGLSVYIKSREIILTPSSVSFSKSNRK